MPDVPFPTRLSHAVPLLADGAMGTLLQARSDVVLEGGFEELNVRDPELVRQVHRDYADAGAELLSTNTFAANALTLGHAGRVEELNGAGVELARAVADPRGLYVAGTIGPLGERVHPYGPLQRARAEALFVQQITALADVDVLTFETFTDHGELVVAIAAARGVAPAVPVMAHTTFGRDDRTLLGQLPGRIARELVDAGADVVGVNCSGGPAQTRRIVAAMRGSVPDAVITAQPNAGYAERVGGRMIYRASPAYFAEAVAVFRELGTAVVGGCCGTTPDHTRAMRRELDSPSLVVSVPRATGVREPAPPTAAPTAVPRTELAGRLVDGRFTTTVEMTPPRSHDFSPLLEAASLLRDAGADLLDVADSPAARMRMSPWAVSQVLQSEVGLETILHFPTRGRNLLRIQGDLLAVHAMGLRNLFVTMGDPTRIGDYPQATDSSDIAPSALIGVIAGSMNAGEDMGGSPIGGPTSFTVGCAVNMCADDVGHELDVLERKEVGGAHFALGQAVFEPGRIEQFHAAYLARNGRELALPVLLGIIPLYSVRQAHFMHNEVPGITIPDRIFRRMEQAGGDAPAEGVRIAQELLAAVKPLVSGAYIIPSLGRYQLAAEVVATA